MEAIASQITSLTIVYSAVYSDADHRKHQSSASLAFVRGIRRGPVNSPHKWPVTRKMFPFDDVIMNPWSFGTHRPFICVSLVSSIILTILNILFWYFSFLKCVISLSLFRIRVWIMTQNSTHGAWYKEDYFILAFVYRFHVKLIYVEHWWNYWASWLLFLISFDHLVFVLYVWSPVRSLRLISLIFRTFYIRIASVFKQTCISSLPRTGIRRQTTRKCHKLIVSITVFMSLRLSRHWVRRV